MNILVLVPANEAHKATLEAAAPQASFTYTSPDAATDEEVAAADVIVGNLAADRLGAAARLRLIQLNSAGYDNYAAAGTLPAGAALCCATGAYGQAVSEHLFASVLAIMKKLPGYRDLQRGRRWGDLGEVRSPAGANVLVLGAGERHPQSAPRLEAHVGGKEVQHVFGRIAGRKRGLVNILAHRVLLFFLSGRCSYFI